MPKKPKQSQQISSEEIISSSEEIQESDITITEPIIDTADITVEVISEPVESPTPAITEDAEKSVTLTPVPPAPPADKEVAISTELVKPVSKSTVTKTPVVFDVQNVIKTDYRVGQKVTTRSGSGVIRKILPNGCAEVMLDYYNSKVIVRI